MSPTPIFSSLIKNKGIGGGGECSTNKTWDVITSKVSKMSLQQETGKKLTEDCGSSAVLNKILNSKLVYS